MISDYDPAIHKVSVAEKAWMITMLMDLGEEFDADSRSAGQEFITVLFKIEQRFKKNIEAKCIKTSDYEHAMTNATRTERGQYYTNWELYCSKTGSANIKWVTPLFLAIIEGG